MQQQILQAWAAAALRSTARTARTRARAPIVLPSPHRERPRADLAITTMNQLISALPGQSAGFTKASVTSVAGGYISLWGAAGNPGAGSLSVGNTTTGAIPTAATAGSFTFTNPSGGQLSYLARLTANSSVTGTVVLYDRLWHGGSYTSSNGTISANTTTAIARQADGAGVELWAEIATALSATATTITVTYVNQDGTGSRTATATLLASSIASRMYPFALQAGDTGIRQITNIAGSAAPTGTFNLVMLKRIAEIPIAIAGVAPGVYDFAQLGMPRIFDSACLALFMVTNTTSSGTLSGSLSIAQG